MTESVEDRLARLGLTLPALPAPIGMFAPAVREGTLVYCSGNGPLGPDGRMMTGKVGDTVTAKDARIGARWTGLALLAALKGEIGSLDRVTRVVKLFGMVNAVPGFTRHPFVIDGCSELMGEVFPDLPRHARSAVGMGSLPNDISVEIEAIFAVAPE